MRPGALLLAVATSLVAGLSLRSPVRLDVIRDRGVLARVVPGGAVENVYRLHLMNATEHPQRYQIDLLGPPGLSLLTTQSLSLDAVEARTLPVSVHLSAGQAAALAGKTLPFQFQITLQGSHQQVTERSTFQVPR